MFGCPDRQEQMSGELLRPVLHRWRRPLHHAPCQSHHHKMPLYTFVVVFKLAQFHLRRGIQADCATLCRGPLQMRIQQVQIGIWEQQDNDNYMYLVTCLATGRVILPQLWNRGLKICVFFLGYGIHCSILLPEERKWHRLIDLRSNNENVSGELRNKHEFFYDFAALLTDFGYWRNNKWHHKLSQNDSICKQIALRIWSILHAHSDLNAEISPEFCKIFCMRSCCWYSCSCR